MFIIAKLFVEETHHIAFDEAAFKTPHAQVSSSESVPTYPKASEEGDSKVLTWLVTRSSSKRVKVVYALNKEKLEEEALKQDHNKLSLDKGGPT